MPSRSSPTTRAAIGTRSAPTPWGRQGTFPLTPTDDGYVWTIPAGPGRTLRYTAVVKDGVWNEVGDLLMEGKPPVRTFEMTLRRVGDTDWPSAGAVSPRAGR